MNYKHGCVINESGQYIEFVLVLMESDEEGILQPKIQGYTLADGESLIETYPPTMKVHAGTDGLVNAKWDEGSTSWVESATEEEIAAWELAHPAPAPPAPTALEDIEALLIEQEYRLALLELGVK